MATIFTKIINGTVPCYKIAEDENYFAFLDISPNAPGHTIVVPKIEDDYIFHLDEETYTGLMLFARRVAKALESCVKCKRIGVAVIGLEVPHTHIHLIPMNTERDMDMKRHVDLTADQMKAIADEVSKAFED